MSYTRKLTSLVSACALLALAGSLAAGCGTNADGTPGGGGGGSCADVGARIDALKANADTLTTVSGSIKTDVITACSHIAGQAVPTDPTDDQVTSACNAAKAAIQAKMTAGVHVVVVPPSCSVQADAQLNCEADCYAKANVDCDPGAVEVRCDPGELSVQCDGTCKVGATCEGSATVAAACEGTCSGECDGSCEGTCTAKDSSGNCIGSCEGTCKGECKGSCKLTADAGVQCSGEARCKGGCDGTATLPKCESNLKPPSCEGSAKVDCSADCQASASMQAQCTKPSIDITGMADLEFKAKLVQELPTLLEIREKGNLALQSLTTLSTNMASVSTDAVSCTLQLGSSVVTGFAATAQAAAKASASASVSFQASASVSASATGSAG